MKVPATKKEKLQVYIEQEDFIALCKVHKNFRVTSESQICAEILSAGLAALAARNYQVTFPIRFEIQD